MGPLGIGDASCCVSCGYLLRGLEQPVCPECGRRFDPVDVTTYDADPRRRRRVRRWRQACVGLALLLLLGVICPRGLLRGNLTLTCARCGDVTLVRRWELKPPRWISFRLPGFHWTTRGTTAVPCTDHVYSVNARFDLAIGGSSSGSASASPGVVVTVNGQPTTPETAPRVLKSVLSPLNRGIRIGRIPARERGDTKDALDEDGGGA